MQLQSQRALSSKIATLSKIQGQNGVEERELMSQIPTRRKCLAAFGGRGGANYEKC